MAHITHAFLDQLETYGPIARTLSMTLRPTFRAEALDHTFVWGDWSAIEARMLPWLAMSTGSQQVLDIFARVDADPKAADIYMIEAGRIHDVDPLRVNDGYHNGDPDAVNMRQGGKVAVLSLGFGGSVGALMAMATNYGLHFTEEQALRIVTIWRANNPWAVNFWDELHAAFFAAFQHPGSIFTAGRVAYVYDKTYLGGTMVCGLPCGRRLYYTRLKFREVEKVDKKTGNTYTKKTLTYNKGYKWGGIWHGILAENITQASAASVLRAKLRALDAIEEQDRAEGYEPLLSVRGHTHDEILCEAHIDDVQAAVAELQRVMDEPLSWSDGLPLVSEVSTHWSYTKYTKG